MPIVPLLFACAALALVWLAILARRRWPLTVARATAAGGADGGPAAGRSARWSRWIATTSARFERTDTNERILRSSEIQAARQPDEALLVDDSIGAELPTPA